MKSLGRIPRFSVIYGFYCGLFFFLFMSILYYFEMGAPSILIGVLYGVVVGTTYGLANVYFMTRKIKTLGRVLAEFKIKFSEDHEVLRDGPAIRQNGLKSLEGWLFFTPEGLFFRGYKHRVEQSKQAEMWIDAKNIRRASTRRSYGYIKNGLLVETDDGSKYKFFIYGLDGDVWVSKIKPASNSTRVSENL